MARVVMVSVAHQNRDSRIFYKEARTLAGAGHQVVLIAPGEAGTVDDVRLKPLERGTNRFVRMTATGWKAYRSALAESADVYHLHDAELLLWAPLLRRTGATVIYDMHEHMPKALLTKRWIRAFRPTVAKLYRWLERRLIGKSPVIFAESSYERDYRWVANSVEVLNMPIVDEVLDAAEDDSHTVPTIGYLGRVAGGRGSTVTLQALAILKERGRHVDWECVGPIFDDHRVELERLIDDLGLDGRVRLHGYKPAPEGWRVMSRCHIGMAVMDPAPNWIESYPTKLFEYMTLGIPSITSDFPLWRAVVETSECGLVVDPASPTDLADAIEYVLDHPDEAEAMGARGRAAVLDRYRWAVEGAKLTEFYEAVTSSR